MTKTIYIQNWVFFISTLRLKFLMISISIWFIFWIFRRRSYFRGEASCVGTHTQSGRSKEKSLQCVWFLKMDRF